MDEEHAAELQQELAGELRLAVICAKSLTALTVACPNHRPGHQGGPMKLVRGGDKVEARQVHARSKP
jgi:hypothetical protein